MEDGKHLVEIPLHFRGYSEGDVTIVADPFNDYLENDETNNSISNCGISFTNRTEIVVIPSPAEGIELKLNLPSMISAGLRIIVYSIDGRIVISHETGELQSGVSCMLLEEESESGGLPAGMYAVSIEGLSTGEELRKVIILNR